MCCLCEKNAFGLVSVFSPGGVLERWEKKYVALNRHVCHTIKCAHVHIGIYCKNRKGVVLADSVLWSWLCADTVAISLWQIVKQDDTVVA